MEDMKPALTDEQWREVLTEGVFGSALADASCGALGDYVDDNRHGLAALSLYETPEGFTQEELTALTDCVITNERNQYADAVEQAACRSGLAKIKALLPHTT